MNLRKQYVQQESPKIRLGELGLSDAQKDCKGSQKKRSGRCQSSVTKFNFLNKILGNEKRAAFFCFYYLDTIITTETKGGYLQRINTYWSHHTHTQILQEFRDMLSGLMGYN